MSKLLLKILTIAWLILMTVLSHTPGPRSSLESQALARWTGVKEHLLRQGAHVFCFLILAVLVMIAFSDIPLWLRGLVLAAWCVIDEATKPMIPGRHFSWKDVGLNLCGAAAGILIAMVISGGGPT